MIRKATLQGLDSEKAIVEEGVDKAPTFAFNCIFRGQVIRYPLQQTIDAQANADGELNKSKRPFYKKLREYQLFEVLRVPYIDYINEYIGSMQAKSTNNAKLLYFKNLKTIRRATLLYQYVSWLVCIAVAVSYGLNTEHYGMLPLVSREGKDLEDWILQLDLAFLPIICLSFVVPLAFGFCEAWSNAVMSQLFAELLAQQEITLNTQEQCNPN